MHLEKGGYVDVADSIKYFSDLGKKLGNALHARIEDKQIDLTFVGVIQALVVLCGTIPKYPTGDDRTCLEHEVNACATAFFEGQYDVCRKHLYEAHQWQSAIERDQEESRAKFQKTPAN